MNNQSSAFIATNAVAVTPSDTADNAFSYLYVGTGGNIVVVTEGGDTVTLNNVPTGSFVWVRTSKIRATSTTASQIVGFA